MVLRHQPNCYGPQDGVGCHRVQVFANYQSSRKTIFYGHHVAACDAGALLDLVMDASRAESTPAQDLPNAQNLHLPDDPPCIGNLAVPRRYL